MYVCMFDGRLMIRNGDIKWPPRSYDLKPLDYCLFNAFKEKCYANIPETVEHLKANIRGAIAEIQFHTFEKGHEN